MWQWIQDRFRPQESDTGSWGEAIAASWLQEHAGFRVVTRNWRDPNNLRREIDIVALDGAVLVFVEVKTRKRAAAVSGRFAVNQRKRRALLVACDAYLRALPVRSRPGTFRFDVVEVSDPGAAQRAREEAGVRHFANVPLFRTYYRR